MWLSRSFWTLATAAGPPWSFGMTVSELAVADLVQSRGRSLIIM